MVFTVKRKCAILQKKAKKLNKKLFPTKTYYLEQSVALKS